MRSRIDWISRIRLERTIMTTAQRQQGTEGEAHREELQRAAAADGMLHRSKDFSAEGLDRVFFGVGAPKNTRFATPRRAASRASPRGPSPRRSDTAWGFGRAGGFFATQARGTPSRESRRLGNGLSHPHNLARERTLLNQERHPSVRTPKPSAGKSSTAPPIQEPRPPFQGEVAPQSKSLLGTPMDASDPCAFHTEASILSGAERSRRISQIQVFTAR